MRYGNNNKGTLRPVVVRFGTPRLVQTNLSILIQYMYVSTPTLELECSSFRKDSGLNYQWSVKSLEPIL